MPHRRPSLLVRGTAAALGLGLALVGCSPDQWGTAARVGDERITIEEVQQGSAEVVAALDAPELTSEQSGNLQLFVLNALVKMELVDQAAARHGIALSDAEVDALQRQLASPEELERQAAAGGVPPSRLRDRVREFGQTTRIQQKIGATQVEQWEKELDRVAREVGVQVNPRYGEHVDMQEDLLIRPVSGGGLSSPAPLPPLTPAPGQGFGEDETPAAPEVAEP